MDIQFRSNQVAQIYDKIDNTGYKDRYAPLCKLENAVKSVLRIEPFQNENVNIFKIPQTGFLNKLILEVEIESDTDNTNLEEFIGARIFENIDLKQYNKFVCSNTPEYILSRIDDADGRDVFSNLVQPDKEFTAGTRIKVYVPIFFSITEDFRKNILLDYVRNLELHCKKNTNLDFNITYLKPTLICYTNNYTLEYYTRFIKKYIEKPVVQYDIYQELPVTLEIGSTSKEIFITNNNLITNIHIIIKKKNKQSLINIDKFTLHSCGRPILEITDRLSMFESLKLNNSNKGFVYYFSINRDRLGLSGFLNLGALSLNKKIVIEYPEIVDEECYCYIIYEYLNYYVYDYFGHIQRYYIL